MSKATKGYREGRKGSRSSSKEMNRLEAQREASERRNKARSEIAVSAEWNSPSRILLPPSIVAKASSTREEYAQMQRLEFRCGVSSLSNEVNIPLAPNAKATLMIPRAFPLRTSQSQNQLQLPPRYCFAFCAYRNREANA